MHKNSEFPYDRLEELLVNKRSTYQDKYSSLDLIARIVSKDQFSSSFCNEIFVPILLDKNKALLRFCVRTKMPVKLKTLRHIVMISNLVSKSINVNIELKQQLRSVTNDLLFKFVADAKSSGYVLKNNP